MSIAERVSVMVAADRLDRSVAFWTALLGEPTFVDGGQWAQFDVGGSRLSIGAGVERPTETTVMVKVPDLEAAMTLLPDDCPGMIEDGPHERRAVLVGPGGETIVLYQLH